MASPIRDAKIKHTSKGFTEVSERGRGYLKSRKPNSSQYALTTQVGGRGWHFGVGPFDEAHEVDTAWAVGDGTPYRRKMVLADYNAYAGLDDAINFDAGQIVQYVEPVSGESVSFQPMQLQWTNDLGQIEAVGNVQEVAAIIDNDILRWIGAFGFDLDFEWQTQTTRLAKRLIVQNSEAVGVPAQYIINGGNPVLKLEFIFQRSSGVRVWVDGEEFDERNNSELTTTGDIEFRLEETGEPIWYFNAPRVWDNSEDQTDSGSVMQVRATAQDLFVSVHVPWSWLDNAIYPVVIDPTIDDQVGASADDAWQGSSPDTPGITVEYNAGDNGYWWGARYAGIGAINQTDTIDTAYETLLGYVTWADDPDETVYAEGAASPAQFTTTEDDIFDRPRTTASVAYDAAAIGVVTPWQGPEINTILQEVVDEYDPTVFVVIHHGDDAGTRGRYWSYDGSSSDAPKLHVEYTVAAEDVVGKVTRTKQGGWPYANPPNTQFTLNTESPLSNGLYAWYSVLASNRPRLVEMVHGNDTVVTDVIDDDYSSRLGRMYAPNTGGIDINNIPLSSGMFEEGTMAIWLDKLDTNYNNAFLVAIGESISNGYSIKTGGSSGVVVRVRMSEGTVDTDTINGLEDGKPHLAVMQWKGGAGGTFWCIVDGLQRTADATNPGATPDHADQSQIGGRPNPGVSGGFVFTQGILGDAYFWDRVLSMDELHRLYQNPWELYAPITRDVFFSISEAAEDTDDLVATDLTNAAWVMGSPTIGQEHALSATELTNADWVLGAPAISQVQALDATELTNAAWSLGTPSVGQANALTATELTNAAWTLDTPSVGQVHALTASGLTNAAWTLSTPAIGQTHALAATELTNAAWTLGTPTAEHVHDLAATELTNAAWTLGAPAIGQGHALTASGLTNAAWVLGTPTLEEEGEDVLTANDLTNAAWSLGAPALGQAHGLTATELTNAAWTLGTPSVGQGHALSASSLTNDPWVMGTPTATHIHDLSATGLTNASWSMGTPLIGQVHDLIASGLTNAAWTLGEPTLVEEGVDTLSANNLVNAAWSMGTPSIGQIHNLTASNLINGAWTLEAPTISSDDIDELDASDLFGGTPTLGEPTISQIQAFTASDLTNAAWTLGTPVLGQVHDLIASNLVNGAWTLGQPSISEGHWLTASDLTNAAWTLGEPGLQEIHVLLPTSISTTPTLGTPTLGQVHGLVATGITNAAWVMGTPTTDQDLGEPDIVNFSATFVTQRDFTSTFVTSIDIEVER